MPYQTLHRFCTEQCGFAVVAAPPMRVADGGAGVERQIDFVRVGLVYDPGSGRRGSPTR
ncbi:MAG: hypothetical protein M3332_14850 [Actinomycetota bacterium]|nr:hypothetical protein [Actinomycetota bacterium]